MTGNANIAQLRMRVSLEPMALFRWFQFPAFSRSKIYFLGHKPSGETKGGTMGELTKPEAMTEESIQNQCLSIPNDMPIVPITNPRSKESHLPRVLINVDALNQYGPSKKIHPDTPNAPRSIKGPRSRYHTP